MSRKPQYRKNDATGELPPDAPTQETEKGLKIGLPKRKDVAAFMEKASRPSPKRS